MSQFEKELYERMVVAVLEQKNDDFEDSFEYDSVDIDYEYALLNEWV